MPKARTHIIAGGYSAGHVTPAFALAEAAFASRPERRVEFMGSADGVEARLVSEAGMAFTGFDVAPWAGRGGTGRLVSLARLVPAIFAARRKLRAAGAGGLTSLGSFAALAPALAAWSLGLPVTIYESNVEPGMANRLLLRRARRLLVSRFYAPRRGHGGPAPEVAGVPLRAGLRKIAAAEPSPAAGVARLLVLGGSLGDEFLNENAPGLAAGLAASAPGLEVTHQCGLGGDAEATRARYAALGLRVTVYPFFNDIAPVLAGAHFVVTPAGAVTLHEVAATGVPLLVVPLGTAALAHQHANAEALRAATGCLSCTEEDWRAEELAPRVAAILGDPACWRERSAALRAFSPEDAGARWAGRIEEDDGR
jgi:UDP-N-acetylglucosamine--N-acetylmuramyl-(pentapeptide) pyrophosphoryl-undecaprenol N-acetylglucosamine transferase